KILAQLLPERIIESVPDAGQFLSRPIDPGKIYPAVYATKYQYDRVELPANTRRFVVIRDLRDTLISGYFSLRGSHPVSEDYIAQTRVRLQKSSFEEGMIWLMDNWLIWCAGIQQSWLYAGEPLIRYEELLENDLEVLERVFLDDCRLPVTRAKLRDAILDNRF